MGAPLAGSEVRASVLTGGKIKFRGLRPKLQSRRLQMIFPLKGSGEQGPQSMGGAQLVCLPSVSGSGSGGMRT